MKITDLQDNPRSLIMNYAMHADANEETFIIVFCLKKRIIAAYKITSAYLNKDRLNRQTDNTDIYFNSIEYFQKLERSLATNLGLTDLTSGIQVIRDKNGWRENEKSIEYIWIVQIARSFVGWGGVFAIRFNENKFREHSNKEELIQGVFISTDNGAGSFYAENLPDTSHEITGLFNLNLFDANKGISLDGVGYNVRIIASNINTFIQVNNPNTDDWKTWEAEIWAMGSRLAKDSNNRELKRLFE